MPLPSPYELALEALQSSEATRDDAWKILARMQAYNDLAATLFSKRLMQGLLVWGVTVGISSKFISEGAVAAFAMKDVTPMLVIAPLLLAVIYADAIATVAAASAATEVTKACYQILFPSVAHDLDELDLLPNLIEVDVAVSLRATGWPGRILKPTSTAFVAVVTLGPLLLIFHTMFLSVSAGVASMWLTVY